MTNYIYTDEDGQYLPGQYLHFTYTERIVYDNISIVLIDVQTDVQYSFEIVSDESPMPNRYNKVNWTDLIGQTVLPDSSFIYNIINYELDNGDKINETVIEAGIIHIYDEDNIITEYENTNEIDNSGPVVYGD